MERQEARRQPGATRGARASGALRRLRVAGAALLLLLGAGVAARHFRLLSAEPPSRPALRVEVIGHTWWWEFRYPDYGFVTANEMHIPVGEPVELDVRSADVVHAFWVQDLVRQLTANPWHGTAGRVVASRAGVYWGECKQLCGLNDANMRLRVVAEPPSDFARWVASHQNPVGLRDLQGEALAGWRLFDGPAGCSSCHTIAGTPAQGKAGPDLTGIGDRLGVGAMALVPADSAHLAAWLRDPQQVKPGATMRLPRKLSPREIEEIVAFLRTQRTYASPVTRAALEDPTRLVGTDIPTVLLTGPWRKDLPVWAPAAALAVLYGLGWRRLRSRSRRAALPPWRAAAWFAGLAVAVTALESPVDALADHLLTFHMVEHQLLIMVAAPLLLMGAPLLVLPWALPEGWRQGWARRMAPGAARGAAHLAERPWAGWLLFHAVLLLWHAPLLYNLAEGAVWVHDLEHLCFLLSALLFWAPAVGLVPGRRGRMEPGTGVAYFGFAFLAGETLAVWFLFSSTPIYSFYAQVAQPWIYGLSPMLDQQLAGAVMMGFGLQLGLAIALEAARWLARLEAEPAGGGVRG
ncbi:MAG: cytochrome c oxidase assembly protein [Bacillota bacterium]|nr:cytochrome c oxidase assembly protein [Bacillota bacterium]